MTGIDRKSLKAIKMFQNPNLTQYAYVKAGWTNYALSNGYTVTSVNSYPGIDDDLRREVLRISAIDVAEYTLRKLKLHGAAGIDRKLLKEMQSFPIIAKQSAYKKLDWFYYASINYGTPIPPQKPVIHRNLSLVRAAVKRIADPQIRAYARVKLNV